MEVQNTYNSALEQEELVDSNVDNKDTEENNIIFDERFFIAKIHQDIQDVINNGNKFIYESYQQEDYFHNLIAEVQKEMIKINVMDEDIANKYLDEEKNKYEQKQQAKKIFEEKKRAVFETARLTRERLETRPKDDTSSNNFTFLSNRQVVTREDKLAEIKIMEEEWKRGIISRPTFIGKTYGRIIVRDKSTETMSQTAN